MKLRTAELDSDYFGYMEEASPLMQRVPVRRTRSSKRQLITSCILLSAASTFLLLVLRSRPVEPAKTNSVAQHQDGHAEARAEFLLLRESEALALEAERGADYAVAGDMSADEITNVIASSGLPLERIETLVGGEGHYGNRFIFFYPGTSPSLDQYLAWFVEAGGAVKDLHRLRLTAGSGY